MANRILLGKDSGGNYCLKVSQPGDNVLSPSEPLIFDSTSVRSGMIYAGGSSSSTTGINWSSTKGTLGYIPLAISMDDAVGTREQWNASQLNEEYQERIGMTETTTTNINPVRFKAAGSPASDSTGYAARSRTATNLKFLILRVPCQYGKMNDSSLWS
tara:strand:+ start:168 stop:641 length:474 start_codon:yes stop_codon:yes gene_type:complete